MAAQLLKIVSPQVNYIEVCEPRRSQQREYVTPLELLRRRKVDTAPAADRTALGRICQQR